MLVNGKRRHTSSLLNLNGTIGRGSSPVDLNTIPVSAIERVEVLRDGASAQYGSDAIAGVVNVVLKGASSGGSLSVTAGQYSAGDGKQTQIAGDTGLSLGDDRGFLHLSAHLIQHGGADERLIWWYDLDQLVRRESQRLSWSDVGPTAAQAGWDVYRHDGARCSWVPVNQV